MSLSHREAARAWGVSRATIQRAVKSGKLSLTPEKTIDPAEMVRVYGEPASRPESRQIVPSEAGVSHPESALLRAENEHLKALLAQKEQNLEDLRRAMALLTHERPSEPRRRWWQR